MTSIEINVSECRKFFDLVRKAANGGFKREFETFLTAIGEDFLRIVSEEIIAREVVDTRILLKSFSKGSENNVWILDEGEMSLTVGTNLEYASYVNDGHWTCGAGESQRFVPGSWDGERFIYDSSAKTGMLLKQKWISGRHYWEPAIAAMKKIAPAALERKLQEWLNSYFG